MKFVNSVIKANQLRLAEHGVITKYQRALYAAAAWRTVSLSRAGR
jgi:hypothetical protein